MSSGCRRDVPMEGVSPALLGRARTVGTDKEVTWVQHRQIRLLGHDGRHCSNGKVTTRRFVPDPQLCGGCVQ